MGETVDAGEMTELPQNFLQFWKCVVDTREGKVKYENAAKDVVGLEEYKQQRPMSKYPNKVKIRNPNGIKDLLELYEKCEQLVMPWIDEVDKLENAMKTAGITIAKVQKPTKKQVEDWKNESDPKKKGSDNPAFKKKPRALYKWVYKYGR